VTVEVAAAMYSVSVDWLYRNKAIKRSKDGSRMVRINLQSLDDYFRNRES
jgi:hypothetical protein